MWRSHKTGRDGGELCDCVWCIIIFTGGGKNSRNSELLVCNCANYTVIKAEEVVEGRPRNDPRFPPVPLSAHITHLIEGWDRKGRFTPTSSVLKCAFLSIEGEKLKVTDIKLRTESEKVQKMFIHYLIFKGEVLNVRKLFIIVIK